MVKRQIFYVKEPLTLAFIRNFADWKDPSDAVKALMHNAFFRTTRGISKQTTLKRKS